MKRFLRSALSRRVMLSMALASMIAILFAQPASAQLRDYDRVYFWESPGFVNDGVELGPSPRAWYLGGVTRDCVIFCWHDWNNIPSSMYVTQSAVATVFTDARYMNGAWQGIGRCMHVRGGPQGRGLVDLRFVTAGLPAGQNWNKQISYVYLHREGDQEPACANG